MYLIVNDNLEYVQGRSIGPLGPREKAEVFSSESEATDIATNRARDFREPMAVIDAADRDRVIYVAEAS